MKHNCRFMDTSESPKKEEQEFDVLFNIKSIKLRAK